MNRHALGLLLRCSVVAVTLFLLSCSMPFFETAQDPLGWSGGGGVGFSAEHWDFGDATTDDFVGPAISASIRDGISDHFSVSAQAALVASLLYGNFRALPKVTLGGKYAFNDANALKLCVGAPLLYYILNCPSVELAYLHDFNSGCTGYVGVGTSGLTPGVTFHFPSSGSMQYHLAFRASVYPLPPLSYAAGLGFGITFAKSKSPVDEADAERRSHAAR